MNSTALISVRRARSTITKSIMVLPLLNRPYIGESGSKDKTKTKMKQSFLPLCLMSVAVASQAFAGDGRTASGQIRVTAQIQGSISVRFTAGSAGPITASGGTTTSFIVPVFGASFSPTSTPIDSADSTFLISSPFEIQVIKANLPSSSYSLRARLATPDSSHSWKIDGVEVSNGRDQIIATHEFYDVPDAHALVVSGSASAPLLPANEIAFQVTAN